MRQRSSRRTQNAAGVFFPPLSTAVEGRPTSKTKKTERHLQKPRSMGMFGIAIVWASKENKSNV